MIYYWSPDYSSSVGGVKILYRHVDILNRNGIAASIIHKKNGFRCTWFENETRISYANRTTLTEEDFLVIPEVYGSVYADPKERPKAYKLFSSLFHTPSRKVVFNQNTYNTFKGFSFDQDEWRSIYRDPSISGFMVVSEDNKEYLEYAFPGLQAFRIHNSIDQEIFSFQPNKKQQIAFMPRKNPDHAEQVIAMLRSRGNLEGFQIVPIANKTQAETAQILRDSLIFLSFGYPEGYSLPPAEAMACGCIVIGYHGMGGREYFTPDLSFPVEMGDIITYAKTVEGVITEWRQSPGALMERTRRASTFISKIYSKAREEQDVLEFWKSIMERCRLKLGASRAGKDLPEANQAQRGRKFRWW